MACFVTSRPMRAIDSVRGIFLGHTCAQFWALPHLMMTPSDFEALKNTYWVMSELGAI